MSTPIPPAGSGIATQAGTSVTATAGVGGSGSGNVSGGTAGSVPTPPPSVAAILRQAGGTLSGTLATRSDAQITVNTPQGQIQITTPTPLPAGIPPGAALLVRVTDAGPPVQVVIQQPGPQAATGGAQSGTVNVGVQGATTTGTLASARANAAPPVPTTPPTLAGTPVTTTLTQGAVVAATVSGQSFTPPPAAGSPAPAYVPPPIPGNVAAQPPPSAGSGAGGSPQSASTAPTAAGTPSANAPAAGPGALPNAAYLPVRIVALQLPGQGMPALTATPAQNLVGTVTGATIDGQSIVSTPNGQLTLATRMPAPPGTLLLLEVAGRPTLPTSAGVPLPTAAPPGFEAFRQAIDALQAATPAAVQNIVQALVPQPGPQLGVAIIFLLQALRSGTLESWLGSNGLRALKRAAGGSSALDRDFSALQGRARDGAGGDWRMFQIPVATAGNLEPLRVYLQDRRRSGQDDDDEKHGQRFVIEANFTRLGPYQFDGLVRDKHLALMIRTVEPVEQQMRDDIHELFVNAVESLGLTGDVGYHVVKAFDLAPVEDGPAPSTHGVTV